MREPAKKAFGGRLVVGASALDMLAGWGAGGALSGVSGGL
jgi:hypothetical protein